MLLIPRRLMQLQLVAQLIISIVYGLVEADGRLVHSRAQRLEHAVLVHEAGEYLLAERVILVLPDQSLVGELGRPALYWQRIEPRVVLLWRGAAHHGSVLCHSRHGHVHHPAVFDQAVPSGEPLPLHIVLLEQEAPTVGDRLGTSAARDRDLLPDLAGGCAEDLRSAVD